MYFGFGEHDAYILCDLPDNKAAAAASLMVGAAGGVNTNACIADTRGDRPRDEGNRRLSRTRRLSPIDPYHIHRGVPPPANQAVLNALHATN